MFTSFMVSGLVVHTPLGPRKSGMPDSVLMPAPVSTAIFSEAAAYPATLAMSALFDRSRSVLSSFADSSGVSVESYASV